MVLRHLAETVFERKRKYPEKEVNQLLAVRHPDAASLRRYLVDEGFMARKSSVYRLRPRSDWPATRWRRYRVVQRSRASVSADTATAPAVVERRGATGERRAGRHHVIDEHHPTAADLVRGAARRAKACRHVALARARVRAVLGRRLRRARNGQLDRHAQL